MILDRVDNLQWYRLNASVRDAFAVVMVPGFVDGHSGKVVVGSEGVFALPQRYVTKARSEKVIEAHRNFVDVQIMCEGCELLGFGERKGLVSCGYDAAADFERLEGELVWVPLCAGQCAVLFPEDAHMPGVMVDGVGGVVKKVVLKVPVSVWLGK